jgi:hypothetical protein
MCGIYSKSPAIGDQLGRHLSRMLVATSRTPDRIAPFRLERFYEDTLASALAAAVSH